MTQCLQQWQQHTTTSKWGSKSWCSAEESERFCWHMNHMASFDPRVLICSVCSPLSTDRHRRCGPSRASLHVLHHLHQDVQLVVTPLRFEAYHPRQTRDAKTKSMKDMKDLRWSLSALSVLHCFTVLHLVVLVHHSPNPLYLCCILIVQ